MLNDPARLEGRSVSGYVLEELVGYGGMGAVYRARPSDGGSAVALKLLLRPSACSERFVDEARRLRDEARATQRLHHPNVVEIYDAGEDEELGPFVVYEYLPGDTLRDETNRGPLRVPSIRAVPWP